MKYIVNVVVKHGPDTGWSRVNLFESLRSLSDAKSKAIRWANRHYGGESEYIKLATNYGVLRLLPEYE